MGFLADSLTALLTHSPGGCTLRKMTQDPLDPGFAFLRSTWRRTGPCAGTGGPRPGRRHLPRVPRAEDGPRAMGDAPWELVSRDGGDGTFLVPKWFR